MTGLFEILDINDGCHGLLPIFKVIRKGIFPIIWIGIPIVLILMGTIDLGKAVMASDDKEIKAAQGRLIKRVIYAVIIFFMVTIVSLVIKPSPKLNVLSFPNEHFDIFKYFIPKVKKHGLSFPN